MITPEIILLVLELLKFTLNHLFHDWRKTMRIPTLFIIIVILAFLFRHNVSRASKRDIQKGESFWEKESKANNVRKKSLDNLHYITIPIDSLPFFLGIDEKLENLQDEIKKLHAETIVNLTGISNTDLKLEYGPANLPALTKYDQNFIRLSRTLCQWGTRLHELSYDKEAIQVLEFGISCKTDIKSHYVLLGKLYLQNQDYDKIDAIIQTASELHTIMKDSIIKELKEMKAAAVSYHSVI